MGSAKLVWSVITFMAVVPSKTCSFYSPCIGLLLFLDLFLLLSVLLTTYYTALPFLFS
jgi:hypothetical protein